jgi:hypothetical protein
MLVVKIELWPFGEASQAKTLALMAIANDQTGTPHVASYDAVLWTEQDRYLSGHSNSQSP